MRSIRDHVDIDQNMMINLLVLFLPSLIYGVEFSGHASQGDLKQILISQKAAARITKIIPQREHVMSPFQTTKIMLIHMLFE